MDFFTLFFLAIILYLCVCIGIILKADSDILTFLALRYGRDPRKVYAGKVIWITGASSGIGAAQVKEFAKYGVRMAISARRQTELERIKKECLQQNKQLQSSDILVVPFDILAYNQHQPAFDKILNHFKQLDVLISNAGRTQRAAWHEIEVDVDKALFDLNVFSLVALNRVVLRHFLRSGGQIVVNSSMGGKFPAPGSGSYIGSKYALQGYFHSLRNEVRFKGIQVTVLCPGAVESGLLAQAFTSQADKNFGVDMPPDESTMTGERCAQITAAAMANGIEEVWIGRFPSIPLLYVGAYLPYVSMKLEWLLCKIGLFDKIRGDGDASHKEKSG